MSDSWRSASPQQQQGDRLRLSANSEPESADFTRSAEQGVEIKAPPKFRATQVALANPTDAAPDAAVAATKQLSDMNISASEAPSSSSEMEDELFQNYFLVEKSPPAAFLELQDVLRMNDVALQVVRQMELHCTAVSRAQEIQFSAKVREGTSSSPGTKVELRRLRGDAVLFGLLSDIIERALTGAGASGSAFRDISGPLGHVQESDETRQRVLAPLFAAAEAPYLDVQLEGLQELAFLSAEEPYAQLMSRKPCAETFLKAAACDVDDNVRRCGLTALAQLVRLSDEVCGVVASNFELIARRRPSDSVFTTRELARLVNHARTRLGAKFAPKGLDSLVKQLRFAGDEKTRSLASAPLA